MRLQAGQFAELTGDWRFHAVTPDSVLKGVFAVGGFDYLYDGRPLSVGAPKIAALAMIGDTLTGPEDTGSA